MSKSQSEFPSPKKLCRALHSDQLGAEETGQKLTYTREELARLATAAATAGN